MFDRLNISDMDKVSLLWKLLIEERHCAEPGGRKMCRSVMSNKSISTNESTESETNDQSAMNKTHLSSSSKYGFIIEKNGTH